MAPAASRKDASKIMLIVYIAVAVYSVVELYDLLPPHICGVTKAIPALLCACNSYLLKVKAEKKKKMRRHAPARYCMPVVLGLLFCAMGDLSLRLEGVSNSGVPYFIIGLASFLIGHVMFVIAYVRDGGNGLQLGWGVLLYGFLSAYVIVILQHVASDDVVLKIGVVAYCVVIATMCHRSISLSRDAYPSVESTQYAVIGSALFVVSDSILAYNRFVAPVPLQSVWVLGTYFSAIALISASCAGMDRWSVGWE